MYLYNFVIVLDLVKRSQRYLITKDVLISTDTVNNIESYETRTNKMQPRKGQYLCFINRIVNDTFN